VQRQAEEMNEILEDVSCGSLPAISGSSRSNQIYFFGLLP